MDIASIASYFNPFDTHFDSKKDFHKLSVTQKVFTVVVSLCGVLVFGVGAIAAFRVCVQKFSRTPPESADRVEQVVKGVLGTRLEEATSEDTAKTDRSQTGSGYLMNSENVEQAAEVVSGPESKGAAPSDATKAKAKKEYSEKVNNYLQYRENYAKDYCGCIADVTYTPRIDIYDERLDLPMMHQTESARTTKGIRKERFEAFLNEHVASQNLEVGTARDNGDCFFDAVAQGLQGLGITADIKSLRSAVAVYVQGEGKEWAKRFIKQDIYTTWDEYIDNIDKSFEDLEITNKSIREANQLVYQDLNRLVKLINSERAAIRALQKSPSIDDRMKIFDHEKTLLTVFCEYQEALGCIHPEKAPIWGLQNRDGQVLADKYKVTIEVTEVLEYEDTLIPNVVKIEPTSGPSRGVARGVVHIALYPGHFVPLLNRGRVH